MKEKQEKIDETLEYKKKDDSSSTSSDEYKRSSQIIPNVIKSDTLNYTYNSSIQNDHCHQSHKKNKTSRFRTENKADIDIEEIRRFISKNNDLSI